MSSCCPKSNIKTQTEQLIFLTEPPDGEDAFLINKVVSYFGWRLSDTKLYYSPDWWDISSLAGLPTCPLATNPLSSSCVIVLESQCCSYIMSDGTETVPPVMSPCTVFYYLPIWINKWCSCSDHLVWVQVGKTKLVARFGNQPRIGKHKCHFVRLWSRSWREASSVLNPPE